MSRFLISGGGTGGHIFPAISIANELKNRIKNVKIEFVGSYNRMEMEKVPENGYNIKGLWISGIKRSFSISNVLIPLKIIFSLLQSYIIIKKFKPDFVIGTGGFASGPLLFTASKMSISTLIQEQNCYPGLTNKILSHSAKHICVAYPEMEKYFPDSKLIFTGNPVRSEIISSEVNRDEAINYFNLKKSKKTLLILGGSLGAQKINEFVKDNLNKFKKFNIQIIWQCGTNQFDEYENLNSENIVIKPFIRKMEYAYNASDLIVSRAGASIISELCIVGKPVIFVPSPNVAEDHQTKNAMSLVNLNAAQLVHEKDLNLNFFRTFKKIILDDEYHRNLSKSIKKLAKPEATIEIVNNILKSIKYAE